MYRYDPLLFRRLAKLEGPAGRPHRLRFIFTSVIVGACDGLTILALVPLMLTLGSGTPHLFTLRGWLWVLGALAAIGFVLRYLSSITGYNAAIRFLRSSHHIIGNKLATLPLGWFEPQRTAMISKLVSDRFMKATETVAHLLGTVLREGSCLIVLTCGAWLWDARLSVTFVLLAPLTLLVMSGARAVRAYAATQAQPAADELSARIVEFAAAQPALRAAGQAEHFRPLEDALAADYAARRKELWQSTLALACNGVIVQASLVAVTTTATYLAVDGSLGPMDTIALLGIVLRYTRCLDTLGQSYIGLDSGRVAMDEASMIVEAPALPEPPLPAAGDASGSVELQHVSFAYVPGNPILREVSFTAQPHTLTAIVGPSGSGKTTIMRLISRFWDVTDGQVLVNGIDIRELGTEQLMREVSMVFQDPYLFDDTLVENIRVGRPDASDADVIEAARLAGVDTISQRLEEGWNTRVGQGGKRLSGGERQRVSIARAVLKDAPIVLLDEATSALDAENEANILACIEQLRRRATVIVIAHKLDTIASADAIIVLDEQGRVAQTGRHEELYDEPGIYRSFWDARATATGWELLGKAIS